MPNMIEYQGYHGTIEYSSEDEMLIGSVFGVRDSLNYHGRSVEEITTSFHECIDEYLALCKQFGKAPDKEYKGTLNIRLTPKLHQRAALEAEKAGISLNQFIEDAVVEKLISRKYTVITEYGSRLEYSMKSSNKPLPITGKYHDPVALDA